MHAGRIISAVLFLVTLGRPKMCLGMPERVWTEDAKRPALTKLTLDGSESWSSQSAALSAYAVETANPVVHNESMVADNGSPTSLQKPSNETGDCPEIHERCESSRGLTIRHKCWCVVECKRYGRCCSDVPYNIGGWRVDSAECIDVKGRGSDGYHLISECQDAWPNEDTRNLCRKKNKFEVDPVTYVPVTSMVTNRSYGNIFCAVCNDDTYTVAWEIPSECNNTINPFNFSLDCQRDFHPPLGIEKPLLCLPNLIASCSGESWPEELKRKCLYYYEPVQRVKEGGTGFTYKNKYCAFCNGVTEDEIYCPDAKRLGPPKVPTYVPLAVLLDVDFSEGGTAVGKRIRCKPGYFFDPWMEECRSVYCGRMYEYRNRKCVRSASTENGLPHNSTLRSDCLKASVDISEYVRFENDGTIVLGFSGAVLNPGEYETLQNDTILVCIEESTNYIQKFSDAQDYLTVVCISVSMCCLLAKIILFFALPEPRKVPTLIVVLLSVSLFVAQLLFLAGSNQSGTALCVCVGVALHYFILASVFWTNVLSFDIWKTFSTVKSKEIVRHNHNLIYYAMYSWGSPLVIIFIGSIMEWSIPRSRFSPEYGRHVCWISNRVSLVALFALPLGLILIVNIMFFVMTAFKICRASKEAEFAHRNGERKNRVRFALYVKLALVMGLTWLFGFVSAFTDNTVMWYLFTVFNGLQGAYILLAFSHFRRRSLKTSARDQSTGSETKSSLTNSGKLL